MRQIVIKNTRSVWPDYWLDAFLNSSFREAKVGRLGDGRSRCSRSTILRAGDYKYIVRAGVGYPSTSFRVSLRSKEKRAGQALEGFCDRL